MTKRSRSGSFHRLALAVLLLVSLVVSVGAADKPKALAKNISNESLLFHHPVPDKPWQLVAGGESVAAEDLLVGLSSNGIESRDGAVRLLMMGDVNQESPFPILEAAVRLHDPSPGYDMDFTLDRGRVDIINQKKRGAARVRIRIFQRSADVILAEPGSRLAVELFGRWAKGARFTKKPAPQDVPAVGIVALVVQGTVEIKGERNQFSMKAPPGPALLHWTTGDDGDMVPQQIDALPSWARPEESKSEKRDKAIAVAKRFRQLVAEQSLPAALDQFLASEDPQERALAVILSGATDDLVHLGQALRNEKFPDEAELGIRVLRHWLGRVPGQDLKFYQWLVDVRKMKPAHAETILQLLHSFSDVDRARPELYEVLIGLLDHQEVGIRRLAYWHLSRLVPAGREFHYDPRAPKEERDLAREKWQKLIPAGQMPPKK